jgi:hypothetical protein
MLYLMVRIQISTAGQAWQGPLRSMTALKLVCCYMGGLKMRVEAALVGGGFVGIFSGNCGNGLCLSVFRGERHANH